MIRFVKLISRPRVEILGTLKDIAGFHAVDRHKTVNTIPGLLLFRFNAPIVFFNAAYFKRQALMAADAEGAALKWFVLDMIPITMIDATGLFAIDELMTTLSARGIRCAAAGRQREWLRWTKDRRLDMNVLRATVFPTLRQALQAFQREVVAG